MKKRIVMNQFQAFFFWTIALLSPIAALGGFWFYSIGDTAFGLLGIITGFPLTFVSYYVITRIGVKVKHG